MNYFLAITFFFICLMAFPPLAGDNSFHPDQQQAERLHLYDEHIEGVYYNYWSAIVLDDNSLLILSEGKTTEFRGFLYLSCQQDYYRFEGSSNFGYCLKSEEELNELVPDEVIEASRKLICNKNQ